MGRLIDADRLKAHYCWWAGGSKEMSIDEAKRDFDTIIDLQPTVEQPQTNATENVVEIVRCKDCKYYNEHPSGFGCCEIHKGSIAIQTPFTFCAWGERREDETD